MDVIQTEGCGLTLYVLEADLGNAALCKAALEACYWDAKLVVATLSLHWAQAAQVNVVAVLLCVVVPKRDLHGAQQPHVFSTTHHGTDSAPAFYHHHGGMTCSKVLEAESPAHSCRTQHELTTQAFKSCRCLHDHTLAASANISLPHRYFRAEERYSDLQAQPRTGAHIRAYA